MCPRVKEAPRPASNTDSFCPRRCNPSRFFRLVAPTNFFLHYFTSRCAHLAGLWVRFAGQKWAFADLELAFTERDFRGLGWRARIAPDKEDLMSSHASTAKPYKGLGMEGAIARWYASLTKKSLEDFKA